MTAVVEGDLLDQNVDVIVNAGWTTNSGSLSAETRPVILSRSFGEVGAVAEKTE